MRSGFSNHSGWMLGVFRKKRTTNLLNFRTRQLLVLCFLFQSDAVLGQHLRPTKVVDLATLLDGNVGISKSGDRARVSLTTPAYPIPVDLAISNGRWAVLFRTGDKQSAFIFGDTESPDSETKARTVAFNELYDLIAIDGSRQVVLRHAARSANYRSYSLWTPTDGLSSAEYRVGDVEATPFLSHGRVLWDTRSGLVETGQFGPRISTLSSVRQDERMGSDTMDRYYRIGLAREGEYAIFGVLSEALTIFSADGRLLKKVSVDLDTAYQSLGRIPPKKGDPITGRSRVIFATSSRQGHLVVCLSETRIGDPAYLAVIEPYTGRFVTILRAALPRHSSRRSSSNPEGVIIPTLGVMDDHLIILDPEAAIAAIY